MVRFALVLLFLAGCSDGPGRTVDPPGDAAIRLQEVAGGLGSPRVPDRARAATRGCSSWSRPGASA